MAIPGNPAMIFKAALKYFEDAAVILKMFILTCFRSLLLWEDKEPADSLRISNTKSVSS